MPLKSSASAGPWSVLQPGNTAGQKLTRDSWGACSVTEAESDAEEDDSPRASKLPSPRDQAIEAKRRKNRCAPPSCCASAPPLSIDLVGMELLPQWCELQMFHTADIRFKRD